MPTDDFEEQLLRDGYLEIKHRCLERGVDTPPHSHDFDTRLLILAGEMTVVGADARRAYRAGETLEIPAGVEHRECYAAEPIRFVAGLRRSPACP